MKKNSQPQTNILEQWKSKEILTTKRDLRTKNPRNPKSQK
jgi:hypothetical protein